MLDSALEMYPMPKVHKILKVYEEKASIYDE